MIFTWSIAHGIRQGTSFLAPNVCGNELLNDGDAWIAGNAILPTKINYCYL